VKITRTYVTVIMSRIHMCVRRAGRLGPHPASMRYTDNTMKTLITRAIEIDRYATPDQATVVLLSVIGSMMRHEGLELDEHHGILLTIKPYVDCNVGILPIPSPIAPILIASLVEL
jgi:hypothetical protein